MEKPIIYLNAMKSLLSGTIMLFSSVLNFSLCIKAAVYRSCCHEFFCRVFRAWEFLILPFRIFVILLVTLEDFSYKYVDLCSWIMITAITYAYPATWIFLFVTVWPCGVMLYVYLHSEKQLPNPAICLSSDTLEKQWGFILYQDRPQQ